MQQAWNTGELSRLRALVSQTESYPGRGFEWSYWQRLCHLEEHTLIGHRERSNPSPGRRMEGCWRPEAWMEQPRSGTLPPAWSDLP